MIIVQFLPRLHKQFLNYWEPLPSPCLKMRLISHVEGRLRGWSPTQSSQQARLPYTAEYPHYKHTLEVNALLLCIVCNENMLIVGAKLDVNAVFWALELYAYSEYMLITGVICIWIGTMIWRLCIYLFVQFTDPSL